jgi:anti-sigma factor RsiW
MDHEDAMRTNAAEGYLLEDLDLAEREAFEAHMFGCVVCAEQVKFFASLRELLHDDPELGSRFRMQHAAAAYVLGDLFPDDRKTFEAHMSKCRTCARNVQVGRDLVGKLRSAIEGRSVPGSGVLDAIRFCHWVRLVAGN